MLYSSPRFWSTSRLKYMMRLQHVDYFELLMIEKMEELVRIHKEEYKVLMGCLETISKRLDATGSPHLDYIPSP